MEYTKIKKINEYISKSINPMKTPNTIFEVYSVPSFSTEHPEYLRGDEIASNKAVVKKNDVLLCKINPRINRVWVVADESEYQNIASSEWIIIRNSDYNPEFLAWYFRNPKFKNLMISGVTGMGGSLMRAQPKNVAEYPVPILKREKQDEIVSILNKAAKVIEFRKKEIQKLDILIKARFVEMFGDCEKLVSLNNLCLIITDGTHQPPKFQNRGIPFILVSNLSKNTVTYDTEKYINEETYNKLYKRTPIEIGDVLLSTVGSYGHPAVVVEDKKFLFQRHIAYLKPKRDMINSFYLHSALLSPNGQRQIEEKVKGIAQKTLNLSEIKKIMIPLPSLDKQNEFEVFVIQVNKSKVAVQKALDEAQLLFDSLMQEYFG